MALFNDAYLLRLDYVISVNVNAVKLSRFVRVSVQYLLWLVSPSGIVVVGVKGVWLSRWPLITYPPCSFVCVTSPYTFSGLVGL